MELTKIKPHCPYLKPKNELSGFHFTEFCTTKLGVSPKRVTEDISHWLDEDHGAGDATIFSAFEKNPKIQFYIVAKQNFVLSGLSVMQQTFLQTSQGETKLYSDFHDGDAIIKGSVVLAGEGSASAVLLAERVAMNFCSKMSGVATKTKSILDGIRKYSSNVILLETRKTTPGLRIYEKYSVRVAGARNHRHALDSGALLKENHLRSIGSIEESLNYLNKNLPILTKIEIEVTNLTEFRAALKNKADVIMLDNFEIEDIKVAVKERNESHKEVKLEISGNLDEKNMADIANLGFDYMSIGALIHKAIWVDLSMQMYVV